MNRWITIELQFFATSILWGVLILLVYDFLRILRRIIRHNVFFVTAQDLIFWALASIFIYAMIYVKNNGTIRGFSVMGIVIGMVLYHYIFSDWIVKLISSGILLLLRPFSLIIRFISKKIKFLFNKGKKINKKIYEQLKKRIKSIRILINGYKQKRNYKANNKKKTKIKKKNQKGQEKTNDKTKG